MPSFCVVHNCSDRYGHNDYISFHRFPMKRKDLLEKWLAFAQRGPDWQPSKWSSICSRHFREEDFSCVKDRKTLKKSAIPTVAPKNDGHRKSVAKEPLEEDEDVDEDVVMEKIDSPRGQSSPILPKVICRLCGHGSTTAVSFGTNFEIYAMIQKCFPTLNIQKEDTLPKDMCRVCSKRLEGFARFIDQVLKTQSDLQRKMRTEKLRTEKLIIKQEPVVRVKQEEADVFDSFLSEDLDMAADEGCDHEHEPALPESVDQKLEFCNFPMLNTQDIINNCDIMEIINLDDAFINIPDDDGNTNACEEQHQLGMPQKQQQRSPSAHELLQAHLLTEEHNYANSAEDLKEEWQMKHAYKTEKTEGFEIMEMSELPADGDQHSDADFAHYNPEEIMQALESVVTNGYADVPTELRSTKPIITSVSEISDSNLEQGTADNGPVVGKTVTVTTIDSYGPGDGHASGSGYAQSVRKPYTKPNIVVLNESIVKSSSPFQLHACPVCQLKFFSTQSLRQHELAAHNPIPMVSVPQANLPPSDLLANDQLAPQQAAQPAGGCKIERGAEPEVFTNVTMAAGNHVTSTVHRMQEDPLPSLTYVPSPTTTMVTSHEEAPRRKEQRNQVNILEMKQTFIRHQDIVRSCREDIFHPQQQQQPAGGHFPYDGNKFLLEEMETVCSVAGVGEPRENSNEFLFKVPQVPTQPQPVLPPQPEPEETAAKLAVGRRATKPPTKRSRPRRAVPPVAAVTAPPVFEYGKLIKRAKTEGFLMSFAKKYVELQRSYQQLQRKFCVLQENNGDIEQHSRSKPPSIQSPHLECRKCGQTCATIGELLRHKQFLLHYSEKPRHFAASCAGCEKFFRSKLALRNHMRYICQSLPLRWLFRTQRRAFKCRYCCIVTFTHWRLYRKHEIRCRQKSLTAQKRRPADRSGHKPPRKRSTATSATASRRQSVHMSAALHACSQCEKVFPNRNALCQHSITHSTYRQHKCGLCASVFKRRNGLMQHLKGYHLQLKPYKCPVCQHAYALKCDMQRCRHSSLRARYQKPPINAETAASAAQPVQSAPWKSKAKQKSNPKFQNPTKLL